MSDSLRIAIASAVVSVLFGALASVLLSPVLLSPPWTSPVLTPATCTLLLFLPTLLLYRWKAWRWGTVRRWLGLKTPYVHGRWEGSIRSTYSQHAVDHPVAVEFHQSINRVTLWYYDANAITRGLLTGFSVPSDGGPSVLYCVYCNQPVRTDQPMLTTHNGVMELYIEPSYTRIVGVYYNNPHQRQTYGDITLRFVGRELRGTHQLQHMTRATNRAEIAILTVIPAELHATRKALGIDGKQRVKMRDGTVYYHGMVRSTFSRSPYRVVLACIGGAGNPAAAAAARDVINYCTPLAVVLVGIAAGIRGKVQIGQVVFSERVVAYEPAALVVDSSGAHTENRPEIERLDHSLLQDLVTYMPDEKRLTALFRRMGCVFPSPPSGKEKEFAEHVAPAIRARTATIASGEKLLRDPAKLLEVRKIHGKTEVGEMESFGIVEACRRGRVPWLVVRGISDFGDEFKDDRFHEFAAGAAASVLSDFIAKGLDLTKQLEVAE